MPEKTAEAVASERKNAKLEHSQGGATTRDDALDAGVPMLPGDPDEPVGPEDAFGVGPKRGDYRERLTHVGGALPHVSVPIPNAKPGEPQSRLEPQIPRAENIGDEKGRKGGVETDPAVRR